MSDFDPAAFAAGHDDDGFDPAAFASGGKPKEPQKRSFLGEVGHRVSEGVSNFAHDTAETVRNLSLPTSLEDAGARLKQNVQPFVDVARGIGAANDFAARAITSPRETFGGGKAGAVVREGMRGINSNIPFANLAVERMGGPPEVSPEDEERAPGARPFGSLAGTPVAGMTGRVATRAVAAPVEIGVRRLMRGAESRATQDIAKDIVSAEGPRARVTDQRRIAEVNDRLFQMTAENPELRAVWRQPAEKALPQIHSLKQKVAAPLDAAYAQVDANTGGIRLGDVLDNLHRQADALSRAPSTLPDADRLRAVAKQFERAWGEPTFDPNAVVSPDGLTAGKAVEMLSRAAQANPAKAATLAAEIDRIKGMAKGGIDLDKRIPTKDFRHEVTQLGKTAEAAMGGLEGTARHEALTKLYQAGKHIIDEHLNASGIRPEVLAGLRDANDKYFLLSRAESAIESRGWKEANRPGGFRMPRSPHAALHMSLPVAAAYGAANPHAIPEMLGAYAIGHAAPAVIERANWQLAQAARRRRLGLLGGVPAPAETTGKGVGSAVAADQLTRTIQRRRDRERAAME